MPAPALPLSTSDHSCCWGNVQYSNPGPFGTNIKEYTIGISKNSQTFL